MYGFSQHPFSHVMRSNAMKARRDNPSQSPIAEAAAMEAPLQVLALHWASVIFAAALVAVMAVRPIYRRGFPQRSLAATLAGARPLIFRVLSASVHEFFPLAGENVSV